MPVFSLEMFYLILPTTFSDNSDICPILHEGTESERGKELALVPKLLSKLGNGCSESRPWGLCPCLALLSILPQFLLFSYYPLCFK